MNAQQQIALVQSGYFKGRRMIVPSDRNNPHVLIERASGFGGMGFHKACLIHDKFIGKKCDECGDRDAWEYQTDH